MGKFVLIPQIETEPDESIISLISLASKQETQDFIDYIQPGEVAALDLETTGLFPRYHRDQLDKEGSFIPAKIVSYGLHAESIGSVCVDLRESYDGCAKDITDCLIARQPKLVGHNIYFDWMHLAALYAPVGGYEWQAIPWHDDTYIQFKLLATEGWTGQKHGLKVAQVDVLGWRLRGDAVLDEWLEQQGLAKGDMAQAPHDILGRYCALDCQSTFMLYHHLKTVTDQFKAFEALRPAFLAEIRCLLQNYFAGIPVDLGMLQAYIDSLTAPIEEASRKLFKATPEIEALMKAKYDAIIAAHPEPKKFTARALSAEPPRITKAGAESVRWLRWKQKADNYVPPEPSATWKRWDKNLRELKEETERLGCAKVVFNPDSWKQLYQLAYVDLCLPEVWTKDKQAAKKGIKQDKLDTSKNAFGSWGPVGECLAKRSKLVQRQSMAQSWYSNTNPETGLLHPVFKIMGTTTTRLAGSGGVNAQNPVKDAGFMDCIREPDTENWVWVDADFCALESVLMAYVAQDAGYLSIYGPNAKPDDIYLYLAGFIPGIKEKLAAVGYTPGCGDKAAIKRAKKECKELRNVAKQAVLAFAYGCGKATFFKTMQTKKVKVDGKLLTRAQCDTIFDTFWSTFSGLKKFNDFCKATWERTGGYVINPLGIPVAACSDRAHNLPNHCIQSVGHMLCMIWLMFVEQEADTVGIEWYPVIYDFHDETLLRVNISQHGKEKTVEIFKEVLIRACELMNTAVCIFGDEVPMKVDPAVGDKLSDFKISE